MWGQGSKVSLLGRKALRSISTVEAHRANMEGRPPLKRTHYEGSNWASPKGKIKTVWTHSGKSSLWAWAAVRWIFMQNRYASPEAAPSPEKGPWPVLVNYRPGQSPDTARRHQSVLTHVALPVCFTNTFSHLFG